MARPGRAFAPGLIALVPLAQYPQGGIGLERNLARNVVGRTAAAQLTGIDDYVPVDASAGAVTVTLPNGDGAGTTTLNLGAEYVILKTDASANAVTIQPATWSVGTDRINGSTAPLVLRQQYAGYVLVLRAGGVLNSSNGDWVAYPLVPGAADMVAERRVRTPLSALTAADVAIDANWGTTATVAVLAGSNDIRGRIDVTSNGTGQVSGAVATVTYKDGAWPVAPQFILLTRGGNGTWTAGVSSTSPTAFGVQLGITPVAGTTYRFMYLVAG